MIRILVLAFFLMNTLTSSADAKEVIRLGTTFSPQQCQYLGLDWKGAYSAILNLPFDIIRIGAYWSEIERSEGVYDFSQLDWLIKESKEKNISVVLTVGMKAPRWPEYFIPQWILEKNKLGRWAIPSNNAMIRKHALAFIKTCIDRYKNDAIIKYWQVENEALNRFGGYRWIIGKDFLKEEVDLVRKADDHHRPIILTASTYPNRFLRFLSRIFTRGDPIRDNLEIGDILGINVYPTFGQTLFGYGWYFQNRTDVRLRTFSDIRDQGLGNKKKIWITELQAEPWEPGQLVHKEKQKPPTGWPETTKLALEELKSLGYETFLFWGAEYWYYQKTQKNNADWWQNIMSILRTGDQSFE